MILIMNLVSPFISGRNLVLEEALKGEAFKKRYDEWMARYHRTYKEEAMNKRFEEWMVVHKRRYKDEEEKVRRYELFKGCVKRVNELNAASRPGEARYKPSRYADFTKEERSKIHGIVVEPSMFDEWNEEQRRSTQRGHDGVPDDDW